MKPDWFGLLWSAVGGSIGLGLALLLIDHWQTPLFLASLGGSTVFLFALTDAEAAQPRALLGGHFGGALIGILCYQMFGDALWVSVLAVILTMVFMKAARMVHPPAGANPLIMVHFHAGFGVLLNPVGLGVLILFAITIVWSRLLGNQRYPRAWW
jgi:CBS-domain-containing membrane protein